MKKNRVIRQRIGCLLIAFALLACALVVDVRDASAQRRRQRRATTSPRTTRRPATRISPVEQEARLRRIAESYLRGYCAFNPTRATALGIHDFNRQLERRDETTRAGETQRLRRVLSDLSRVNSAALSPQSLADYFALDSHARRSLAELETLRTWQRDAGSYTNYVAAGIDSLLKRDIAPAEQQLRWFVSRAGEIPRVLAEARRNITLASVVHTRAAIADTRGAIDYFNGVVPQQIERVGAGRLNAARRNELSEVNGRAVVALREHLRWLQSDLLPRSNAGAGLGEDGLRATLIGTPADGENLFELARLAETELRQTQERMRRIADEVAPGRGLSFALALLNRERPSAEGLTGEMRAELDRVNALLRQQDIFPVATNATVTNATAGAATTSMSGGSPRAELFEVAETPAYRRAALFDTLDAPGWFERTDRRSFYYVTAPEENLDERRREEHLSRFNRYQLPFTAINQIALNADRRYATINSTTPSSSSGAIARRAFAAQSFDAAWGRYSETLLLELGFGGNNPKLQLAHEGRKLLGLCRQTIGVRLHTQSINFADAVEFFVREGFTERTNAEREVVRLILEPATLADELGAREILRLRAAVQQQRNATGFSLRDFHIRLLNFGGVPVKNLRALFAADARTDAYANDTTDARNTTNGGRNTGGRTNSGAPDLNPSDFSLLDFSLIATGTNSQYEGARRIQLITNENEWLAAWRAIGGGRPVPNVNFNTRSIIVAYQGTKPSGGYAIEIAEVRLESNIVRVRVNERTPARDMMQIQMLTSPFVAVSIPRVQDAVRTAVFANAARTKTDAAPEFENSAPQTRKGTNRPRTRRRRGGNR